MSKPDAGGHGLTPKNSSFDQLVPLINSVAAPIALEHPCPLRSQSRRVQFLRWKNAAAAAASSGVTATIVARPDMPSYCM